MAVYFEEEKLKAAERKVKVWEVVLRCAAMVLGATAVALIVSNKEVKVIMSVEETAKFTNMKAMV